MIQIKNTINFFLILLNIFFLIYYSTQLLVFTDEFAKNNIGFFNHAIAGLSEIIGLIFFCLAIGLVLVILRGPKNQLPLLATIYLIQLILSLNFWRYVITDSPGETSIEIIMLNAHIFSLTSFSMLILLLRLKKYI